MPSNQINYIRIQRLSYRYRLCLPSAFFFSKMKTIKEQLYSQILELRITFVSLSKNVTYDHYLTKSEPVLQWKLLPMLDKNPEVLLPFDFIRYNHSLLREFFNIYLVDFFRVIVYNKCY